MMSELPDFNYHPMCKKLKLTYLIFSDDLMIFRRGDVSSESYEGTSISVTVLFANEEKSNIFLASIEDSLQAKIHNIQSFLIGSLPIRYPGLPLSSNKWGKWIAISWLKRSHIGSLLLILGKYLMLEGCKSSMLSYFPFITFGLLYSYFPKCYE